MALSSEVSHGGDHASQAVCGNATTAGLKKPSVDEVNHFCAGTDFAACVIYAPLDPTSDVNYLVIKSKKDGSRHFTIDGCQKNKKIGCFTDPCFMDAIPLDPIPQPTTSSYQKEYTFSINMTVATDVPGLRGQLVGDGAITQNEGGSLYVTIKNTNVCTGSKYDSYDFFGEFVAVSGIE
jgi:hypothetical protein